MSWAGNFRQSQIWKMFTRDHLRNYHSIPYTIIYDLSVLRKILLIWLFPMCLRVNVISSLKLDVTASSSQGWKIKPIFSEKKHLKWFILDLHIEIWVASLFSTILKSLPKFFSIKSSILPANEIPDFDPLKLNPSIEA